MDARGGRARAHRCGQSGPAAPGETPAREAAEPLTLTCDVFANESAASLSARFGGENMLDQTLPGPEGETYEATVLFPDNPARRIEITWSDAGTRAQVASLSVAGDASEWTGPAGLRLGMSIADVAAANGGPFKLYGFDWDYGGWVSDWNGGALAAPTTCLTRVRFAPAATSYTDASGDSEFASDSPGMRAANPHAVTLSLVLNANPASEAQK